MKIFHTNILILSALLLTFACSERADNPEVTKQPWAFERADSFLTFINTQASLGPGRYDLVVGTQANGQSGEYVIDLEINGEQKRIEGAWNNSGGKDAFSANNPSHKIDLAYAGGITSKTVSTSADIYLYLLKNDFIIAEGSEIDLPISQIDSQAYTDAYYRAVDPNNERSTLGAWKRVNGFDKGHDVHIVFRDTKDLGYGRNMYVRKNKNNGNISFFVQNYAADLGGDEGRYNRANVTAAINEMHEYHIGTNAIEFSPLSADDPEKILKFFTFRREQNVKGATEHRMDSINLDGRGDKQMPIPCLVCHGARLLPLDANGEFQLLSLKSAKLNQLEVESFEFADSGVFSKQAIESQIKIVNEFVNEVYEEIGNQNPENFDHWDSSFALELSNGRYGGTGFPSKNYVETFIPDGWRANASRPDGVEHLFSNVIQPHCVSCHSIRGKTAAEVANIPVNDINFSSYEKFISYNDEIIDYVYRRGIMPLSLLNFNAFWAERDGAPALLASFLSGFDLYDDNNMPLQPGRPFAKPGENRTAWSPVQLNGSASLFTKNFQWHIINQPNGANASFNNAKIPNPVFTADTNGNYVLELQVSNDLGKHSRRTTLTIDDTVTSPLQKHQSQLNFVTDIMNNIMGAENESLCASCHRPRHFHEDDLGAFPLGYDGLYDGIPVFYTYYTEPNMGGDVNRNLYRHVRARVNLADPENSLLLRKPVGKHHGGGVRFNRSTLAGETQYQILLNWIREGAICGDPDIFEICQ